MATSMLAQSIQLCYQVKEAADDSSPSVKTQCAELKAKTERLARLLHQAARIGSHNLYQRPALRMFDEAEQGLKKALALTLKTRAIALISNRKAAFQKVSAQLENSIGDISWLLAVLSPGHRGDGEYLELPPIAANEPILCMIWKNIAVLLVSWSTPESRADAAASLASVAKNNVRHGKLIIQEGGVGPLIRLLGETSGDSSENASRALGILACCPENLQLMVDATICSAFHKILEEESMKTKYVDASPSCQEAVAKRNVIRLLVSHLSFETVEDQQGKKAGAIGRHHNVEKKAHLPSSWFMPNSPAANAIVDQLLKIVEKPNSELLLPCVKAIGCLATTFRATENRIIAPLVRLLDEREDDVTKEAVQALVKFANTDNYLHVDYSKVILDAGGAGHLVQLVYFGEAWLQVDALVLLGLIAEHVPESEALAQADVLAVLEWASKQARWLVQEEKVDYLLAKAKARLELFQWRRSAVLEGSAQAILLTNVEEEDLSEEEEDQLSRYASRKNTHKQDHIVPTPGLENNSIDIDYDFVDYDGRNGEKIILNGEIKDQAGDLETRDELRKAMAFLGKSMGVTTCEVQGQQKDKNNLVASETTLTDTSSNALHSFSTEGHTSYKDKRRIKILDLIKDAVNDLKEASVFESIDIENDLRQLLDLASRYDLQVQPLYSLLNDVSRLNESFSIGELNKLTSKKEKLEKQRKTLSSTMVDLRIIWDATKEKLIHITQKLKELQDEEQSTRDFLVLQQSELEEVQKAMDANDEALEVTSSHIEALRVCSTMAEDEFKALVINFTFELAPFNK